MFFQPPVCLVWIPVSTGFFLTLGRFEELNGLFQLKKFLSPYLLPYVMWPLLWVAVRTYAPYITFPVAFVVGAVGYNLEWFIRGEQKQPVEEKSIFELREERKLAEITDKDCTKVLSLKDKLEFTPKAVLNRNRPDKASNS
ncbi:small integral membrane protein 12 isoform X1 [Chiloscyllium punctatum]|uniref:small integral membrane protein 12 isoform X1 n=2 Tax=Chiloscyllium punctatum TaxID=137246 RepID=UPI003B63E050